jgi:hypothetical protein
MHPGAQAFRRLWIDVPLSHDAPERGLNVLSGTSETIVEIEMPECSVKVVTPEQPNHAAAEPDAFRIAGRAAHLGRSLGEFINPALRILCRIGLACLRRLIAWLAVRLCQRAERGQNRRTKCNGEGKRGKGHERAGFYGAVMATTDVLISLYNDWVSIATCRSNPTNNKMPNLRGPCPASAANVLKVPHLGSVAGNG